MRSEFALLVAGSSELAYLVTEVSELLALPKVAL